MVIKKITIEKLKEDIAQQLEEFGVIKVNNVAIVSEQFSIEIKDNDSIVEEYEVKFFAENGAIIANVDILPDDVIEAIYSLKNKLRLFSIRKYNQ